MCKIDLKDVRKLNIEKGDIIVIKKFKGFEDYCKNISRSLGCKVIAVDDLSDIGIIKFSDEETQESVDEKINQDITEDLKGGEEDE